MAGLNVEHLMGSLEGSSPAPIQATPLESARYVLGGMLRTVYGFGGEVGDTVYLHIRSGVNGADAIITPFFSVGSSFYRADQAHLLPGTSVTEDMVTEKLSVLNDFMLTDWTTHVRPEFVASRALSVPDDVFTSYTVANNVHTLELGYQPGRDRNAEVAAEVAHTAVTVGRWQARLGLTGV